MKKISWGILSTARIGIHKVIPAMQNSRYSEVIAIASRSMEKAAKSAKELGIKKAYSSYEELLADPDIEAVYIPLPNHMHSEWTIRALNAGKNVLCEKPIGLNASEAEMIMKASKKHAGLKLMEAFMYRMHPQWLKTKELVQSGRIGKLSTVHSFFSYFNTNPDDIRNKENMGGGALMDIGCYCVSLARFLFNSEPHRVLGKSGFDPNFKIDEFTTGVMEFKNGLSSFTCATQLAHYQRVNVFGTEGRIEIEIPFNAPSDRKCRIWLEAQNGLEEINFDICNQYTIQGDLFSQAIINNTNVPTQFQDAVNNMRVIDALVASSKKKKWVNL